MKIEAAPNVTLDSINALEANKHYFLSSTTGQIKEASIWMRMKCAIGIGSARTKVNNLVDAVKATLLERAGKSGDAALDAAILEIDPTSNLKGRVIKDLATRFRAANSGAMLRKEAETLAKREASTGFLFVHQRNMKSGHDADIIPIFRHAFKAVTNGDLPTKTDGTGRTVLDKDALAQRLRTVREEVTELLLDIGDDARLGRPTIDRHYAQHIISTFFKEDGTRSKNAIADALPPDEAYATRFYNLDDHNNTNNSFVSDELVRQGRDPIAYAKHIRELCGGDKDLEDIVEMGLRNICATGENELRSDEAVERKIAAIKDNLDEAREVEKKFPGFMDEFREAMFDLGGGALPKGSIQQMAEGIEQADLSKLAKLNSFSGCGSILRAVDQLRTVCDHVANPWRIFPEEQGEGIMFRGPEYNACHRIGMTLAVLKAGPAARVRIANAVQGTAYREAAYVLEVRMSEAESDLLYQGREQDVRKRLFGNNTAISNEFFRLFQPHDRIPENPDTEGITWEQAMAHNDVAFDEIFDDHIAKALAVQDG